MKVMLSMSMHRALVLIALGLTLPTGCGDSDEPAQVKRLVKWMVDSLGRVVIVHGFNVVEKNPPFVRTEFRPDDAELLAIEVFTVA